MFTRRHIVLCGAGLALGGSLAKAGQFVPGETLDEIIKRGTIRIGAYRDFAPYSFEEDGVLKGTDIEIAKLIAEGLKIKALPELRNAAEDVDGDLRGHVWRGPVEGTVVNVMLHMPIDHELSARNDMVVMGAPYAGEKTVLCWSKAKNGEILNMLSIKENMIAVNISSLADNFLLSYAGGTMVKSIIHKQTFEQAFEAMISEEASATMGSINEIEWAFRKYPEKRSRYIIAKNPPAGLSLGNWGYGIAVRTNYRDLYYTVEEIINAAIADGRIQKIFENYGLTYTPPPLRE